MADIGPPPHRTKFFEIGADQTQLVSHQWGNWFNQIYQRMQALVAGTPAEGATGTSAPTITQVTALERPDSRELGTDTLERWGLRVVVSLSSKPPAGEWINFELSLDDGKTWQYVSRKPIASQNQTFDDLTSPGNPYSDFQRFVPQDDSTCRVRVYAGSGGWSAPLEGGVISDSFQVAGVGLAPDDTLKDCHLVVQPDGRPYRTSQDAQGHWLWGADISMTCARKVPNLYYWNWSIQHIDADGNVDPDYGEVEGNEFQGEGTTKIDKTGMNWALPALDDPYPGRRYYAYAASRYLPITRVKQTHCWPGGLDHQDVFPVSGVKLIDTVVAEERDDSRELGTDTLTRWGLRVTVNLLEDPVPHEWVNFEISLDNGTTWECVSRQPITAKVQVYDDTTDPGGPNFQRFVPQDDSTCLVRCFTGTGGWDAAATDPTTSAPFTVLSIGLAPDDALTDTHVVTPLQTHQDEQGHWLWGADVSMTSAVKVPNLYYFNWGVQHVDHDGNIDPVYGEVEGNEFQGQNVTKVDKTGVNWALPDPDSPYLGFRYQAYAASRWLPITRVKQTVCWPGGLDHQDVFPVSPVTALASVAGIERVGSLFFGADTLIRWGLKVTIILTALPAEHEWVNFEISLDDGDTWQYVSRQPITSQYQEYSDITTPGGPDFQRFMPDHQATCRVRCFVGTGGASTPPTGAMVSAPFTVAGYTTCPATDITNAHFLIDPITGDPCQYNLSSPGVWDWNYYEIDWTQPTTASDPSYWFSCITVQKGYEDEGGTWHPAPDPEGKDEASDLYHGRWIIDSGAIQGDVSIPGSTVMLRGDWPPNWLFPPFTNIDGSPNLYRTFRFWIYAVSQLGRNPAGGTDVFTLQTCWPGGADHYDVTPTDQPRALEMGLINPRTINLDDFQIADGVFSIHGLDFRKALAGTFDGTNFDNSGELFKIGSKGIARTNIADNAIDTPQLNAGAVTTAILTTSSIDVGGGGGKPIRVRVLNAGGLLLGWIGDDVANSGYIGAWFKQLRVGGDAPANAPLIADVFGDLWCKTIGIGGASAAAPNMTVDSSGNIWGKTIGLGGPNYANAIIKSDVNGNITINGAALTLNLNGIVTKIDNSYEAGFNSYGGLHVSLTGTSGRSFVGSQDFGLFNTNGHVTMRAGAQGSSSYKHGVVSVYSDDGTVTVSIGAGSPYGYGVIIDGDQIVTARKTGPGNPSFASFADVQTWCQNLYNALNATTGHGLLT